MKKGLKFFLSNNIKLAMRLKLDGAYIPSFNKELNFNSYNFQDNNVKYLSINITNIFISYFIIILNFI